MVRSIIKFLKWNPQWWFISLITLFIINTDLIMGTVLLLLITNKTVSCWDTCFFMFIFYIGLNDVGSIIWVVEGPVSITF